ncbi:MAG: hypothetical protein JOY51_03950, partial [Nevskia sp.]|nr:hypothetical protein [Nevskia sp.]
TDHNNSNLYQATVSPTGGSSSLSPGTPVNGVSVLNNNLNISAVHPAIIYRPDVNASPGPGELYMPEEATGLNTGQNVALVAVKADLSDVTQLRPNINVYNVQSTQLRISGVSSMAVNRGSDGTFQFLLLGAASRTITTITLDATGLARSAGQPQTFPVGDNNPIAGSNLVITTD